MTLDLFPNGRETPPRARIIRGSGRVQIVRPGEKLTPVLAQAHAEGTLALVPTMGALHAGHVKLVEEAKRRADKVIATIFVNPKQFGPSEDLGRYPRQEEQDLAMLAEAGCDFVWLPAVDDIYPPGFATTILVAGVSERWEGEARPGHFEGVATVVARLLSATIPDVAVFGEKDFQQLAVIRRMVADLRIPAEIIGVPTVRDGDGLALSSRNAYLSADDRQRAAALPKTLRTAADSIGEGASVADTLDRARNTLTEAGFSKIDYLALVDAASLEPLGRPVGEMRLIAAATIGGTRLIDNLAV